MFVLIRGKYDINNIFYDITLEIIQRINCSFQHKHLQNDAYILNVCHHACKIPAYTLVFLRIHPHHSIHTIHFYNASIQYNPPTSVWNSHRRTFYDVTARIFFKYVHIVLFELANPSDSNRNRIFKARIHLFKTAIYMWISTLSLILTAFTYSVWRIPFFKTHPNIFISYECMRFAAV